MNKVLKISSLICFAVFFVVIGSFVAYRHMQVAGEEEGVNLLIAGSTTLNIYIRALAEEYQRRHPNTTVVTAGGGSTAGLIAVTKGAIDLGGMSRPLSGPEDDEHTKSYLIARDGVAVVVHKDNPIRGLTVDQVRDIFAGKIMNWMEVGGNPAEISVFIRDENSTTRGGFEELVMGGEDYTASALSFDSHKELSRAMEENPNAIGYFRAFWLGSGLGNHVKGLEINGVSIKTKYLLSSRYPLTRSLFLVTYGEPSEEAVSFLDFSCSPDGQKVMERLGAIPVY
jgi:phosphate transport system substrate-binding protein